MPASQKDLFKKLSPLAKENGIDLEVLRRVIDESDGYGDVVSRLAMEETSIKPDPQTSVDKMNTPAKRQLMTGDGLNEHGQPIKREAMDKFSDDNVKVRDNITSMRERLRATKNRNKNANPELLFPEGSDILNLHRRDTRARGDAINAITDAVPKHHDDEVKMPDTTQDYNMFELVRESIKAYKEHKNRYNSKADKIAPFSQIQAQLY